MMHAPAYRDARIAGQAESLQGAELLQGLRGEGTVEQVGRQVQLLQAACTTHSLICQNGDVKADTSRGLHACLHTRRHKNGSDCC